MTEVAEDTGKGSGDRMLSLVTRLLTVAAVLASVGGVFLHLCGYIAQRTQLQAFNIDPDSFTREADWMMIHGYYSIIQFGSLVPESIFSWTSLWIFLGAFGAVVYVRFLTVKDPPAWLKKIALRIFNKKSRVARWMAFLVESLMYSGLAWSSGYFLVLCAFLALLFPAAMGQEYGKKMAIRDAQAYQKGCLEANPCTELWKDEKKIASGFVVATSSDRIAFFDTQVKMVRQLERSGVEVRSPVDPKLDSPKAK